MRFLHVAFLLASVAPAHAAPTAFDRLKALDGAWTALEGGQSFDARFETVARGAAVLQRSGFVAVFHPDGDALLVSLYPDDGYYPRLRATGAGPKLEFKQLDVANAKAAAGKSVSLTFELATPKRLVQTWTWHTPGAKDQVLEIVFVKK